MSLFKLAAPRICRTVAVAPRLSPHVMPGGVPRVAVTRAFSRSATLYKKDKYAKGGKKPPKSSTVPSSSGSGPSASEGHDSEHPAADPQQPRDLADVESRWARTEAHYVSALQQFKAGGSFNPDVLGAIPVRVGSGKDTKTYPLRELAQVVPRTARSISLLAFEKGYIKPLMSAIQASPDFNQQPQPDADNELELVLRTEAVSISEMTKKLGELCHAWREQVRNIRAKREKVIQAWTKDKTILPDLAKLASADLLKATQKHLKAVDTAEAQAAKEIKRKASS